MMTYLYKVRHVRSFDRKHILTFNEIELVFVLMTVLYKVRHRI